MPKSKTPAKRSRAKLEMPASRQIKAPTYRSFRLSKRIKQPKPRLTGAFRLLWRSLKHLVNNWKVFGGIVFVYLVLTIVLVKGFGVSSNIGELKTTFVGLFHGRTAGLSTGLTLFGVLLGNANSTASDVAGAYQSMLLIIISLVLIWALRQTHATKKAKVTIRQSFYKGLHPTIPFLLVLIVIGLQIIPVLIANFLYTVVIGGGLAVTAIEKGLWFILIGLLVLLTLYLLTSSIFALYIVTLPDVTPMMALRSARDLVRYRRWMIMRKLVFLPIALLVLAAVIVIPFIIIAPAVAEWLFFILSMLTLAVVHSYMYSLYRELL